MTGIPERSSGFAENPPGDDKGDRLPRVLRDVTLQWLSLDLWPGPYSEIARVTGQGDGG